MEAYESVTIQKDIKVYLISFDGFTYFYRHDLTPVLTGIRINKIMSRCNENQRKYNKVPGPLPMMRD